VKEGQWDALALAERVGDDVFTFYLHGREAEVPQGSNDGETGGVDEVSIVREDVHVGADTEDGAAGEEAERFGIEGPRAAEGFLEEAREEELGFGGGAGGVDGGWHGRERGSYGEEAIRGPVGERGCDFGGYFCEDSKGVLVGFSIEEDRNDLGRRGKDLVFPNRTSETPYSSPNSRVKGR